jgi:SAM-dependent methyltransferase
MTADKNGAFDKYADDYDAALTRGISVSGENKDYFERRRIEWLCRCLPRFSTSARRVMDYGCGIGSSAQHFLDMPDVEGFFGVDQSQRALEIARRSHPSDRAHFNMISAYEPYGQFDLAYCNGVFHHIPPADRGAAIDYIYRALRRGGVFALWENNPWNPGTRYVMGRIPFDRDAITLGAPEARRLVRDRGFDILRTDFLFLFPRILSWFRWIEPLCSRLPLGAQYQVLCRKP